MNKEEIEELGKRLEPYYDLETGEPKTILGNTMPERIAIYKAYKEAEKKGEDILI